LLLPGLIIPTLLPCPTLVLVLILNQSS
jgi:hypothetical protein